MIIRIVMCFIFLFQYCGMRGSDSILLKNDTIFCLTDKKPVLRIQKRGGQVSYYDMTCKTEPEIYKAENIYQRDSLEGLIRKELYKEFEEECPVMTITYILLWKKNRKLKDVYLIQSYDGINYRSVVKNIKRIIKKAKFKGLFEKCKSNEFYVGRVRLI